MRRLLPILLLAAACDSGTEPPPVLTWQGAIVGTEAAGTLSGSVAMASNAFHTQIGIRIGDGAENSTYSWAIRAGSCTINQQVAPASAFPLLRTNDAGDAETEAVINRRLPEAQYVAVVYSGAGNAGTAVACGTLEPRV